mgnify:CR=1 FL=1
MKWIAILMMLAGGLLLANTVIDKLSVDALGMAIGMTLGVLAGVPTAALVFLARRRDDEDGDADYDPPVTISQYPPAQPPVVIVCREDVTPYYNGMRRLLGDPPLPSRADLEPTALTPHQISELEAYIEYQKAGGIRQVDPRQFVVRFEGEVQR